MNGNYNSTNSERKREQLDQKKYAIYEILKARGDKWSPTLALAKPCLNPSDQFFSFPSMSRPTDFTPGWEVFMMDLYQQQFINCPTKTVTTSASASQTTVALNLT